MSSESSRRALLIGINKYDHPEWELRGCVNDVEAMRTILEESFGFPAENIRSLTDGAATRQAILDAMKELAEQTGQDDGVLFQYAGHGSQMTDRDGDEPDGMDETIMPCDTGREWTEQTENRDITDDEINAWLLELRQKTANITLIFDCCHSGTITRDPSGDTARFVEPDTRPVEQLPPAPVEIETVRSASPDTGPSGWLPIAEGYVLIAGCRDEELSYEKKVKEGRKIVRHGAMSYYLCQELRKAISGTTYRDVFERVMAAVNASNGKQHPQMEGRLDRVLFGVEEITPMRFIRLTERSGDSVTLAAGAAHGMRAGSKWKVYPQGTKVADDGTPPLGVVEITSVGATTSNAVIEAGTESAPAAITADARAVEDEHFFGETKLTWEIVADDAKADALRADLEMSKQLRPIAAGEIPDARIYLIERDAVAEGDPAPQVGAPDVPTWAVVTESGDLLMKPKTQDDIGDIRHNLELLLRKRMTLAVDNPDRASGLNGKVDFELLRQRPNGEWVVAEPEIAGGTVVFEESEKVAFSITNRHSAPLYPTLVSIGISGSILRLYPWQDAAPEPLAAGRELVWPPKGGSITLHLPDGFPYSSEDAAAEFGDRPVEGIDNYKLFVTEEPVDFRYLEQEGTRAASQKSLLEALLLSAVEGPETRDPVVSMPVAQEDWTTVLRPLTLRRRVESPLSVEGAPVKLGEMSLQTPGLSGTVKTHDFGSAKAANDALAEPNVLAALGQASVSVQKTIEIAGAEEVGPATRSTDLDEPAIELDVPEPGASNGQMVLVTDEAGVMSWHFAPEEEGSGTRSITASGRGARSYVIRRTVAPSGAPATRGLVGAVGKKFLNVMVFPLLDPVFGAVGDHFAGKYEQAKSPYRLRTFTPDDFGVEKAGAIDGGMWEKLGSGRSLLMVHGTFSRAHTAFGTLPRSFVEELHGAYDGRVFALDHFTISHDPKENVEWLIEHMPDGTALDVDIICHSRGGLVSRVLAEKSGELATGSRRMNVGNVVFVGSPNAGTALADPDHIGSLIDRYTNILNFFDLLPDTGVIEVLDGIIMVAKQLAVGAMKGLKGLQAMRPSSEGDPNPFTTWLDSGELPDVRYFALASDFEPTDPGLKGFLFDKVADRIFSTAGNDLVVPTSGVWDRRRSEAGGGKRGADGADGALFPIPEPQRHVFDGINAVNHCGYFADALAREKIMGWLSA